MIQRILCLLILLGLPFAAGAETAETLFRELQSRIYQIRVIDRFSENKASIGSGFQVDARGLLASNFHVIAEAVYQPERYRIEYVDHQRQTGALSVLDVDVVHDLAVLQAEGLPTQALPIREAAPAKGARMYAMGNPHDLGMSIVEGVYNGLLERSLYEKIFFSGSLNPGMSGGPALDAEGRVIGVNVSTAGNDLSFQVPARFLQTLLDEVVANELRPVADINGRIQAQLLANQAGYMNRLLGGDWPTAKLGPLALPGEIAPFLRCWGDTSDRDDQLYRSTQSRCGSDDAIFLSRGFATGDILFNYQFLQSEGLGPARFYRLYERHFGRAGGFAADKEDVTEFRCHTQFMQLAERPWKVAFCARRYKRFPKLYDSHMALALLSEPNQGLVINVGLTGVSRENAKQFMSKYLETIQ